MARWQRVIAASACALLLATGCTSPTSGPHSEPPDAPATGATSADLEFVGTPQPATPDQIAAAAARARAGTDTRPNVVIVMTDDMRTDELAWMPITRSLIGRPGMEFTHAISAHPLCCPARAQILTGQYAQNNGVRHNGGRWGGYPALNASSTIATDLHAAGYATGFLGKHLNTYRGHTVPDPGWSWFKPINRGEFTYDRFRFFGETPYRDAYVTDTLNGYATTMITDLAGTGRPFVAIINQVAPHSKRVGKHRQVAPPAPARHRDLFAHTVNPAEADPAFNEADISDLPAPYRDARPRDVERTRHWFRARIRSLQAVDEGVAQLVDRLEELGELDNTYLVFTSDNGYALGEHRMWSKDKLIAPVLSIPLLVRGPGIAGGSTSSRITTLADLSATILHLADAPTDRVLDGEPAFGPGRRRGPDARWRDTTLVLTGSARESGANPGWGWRGVQTWRYLFVRSAQHRDDVYLFDRRLDPHEMTNVAEDPRYRQVRLELAGRLRELISCAGPACNQRFGPVTAPRLGPGGGHRKPGRIEARNPQR